MYRLKVREVAQRRKMSQRQLFLRSGVDIRTVRNIFRDDRTGCTAETLSKLAATLDVDVSELIESVPPGKKLDPLPVEAPLSNEPDEPDSEEE